MKIIKGIIILQYFAINRLAAKLCSMGSLLEPGAVDRRVVDPRMRLGNALNAFFNPTFYNVIALYRNILSLQRNFILYSPQQSRAVILKGGSLSGMRGSQLLFLGLSVILSKLTILKFRFQKVWHHWLLQIHQIVLYY